MKAGHSSLGQCLPQARIVLVPEHNVTTPAFDLKALPVPWEGHTQGKQQI